MSYAAKHANAAAAAEWAAKRRDAMEKAKAIREAKRLGEVGNDHTFIPKTNPRKGSGLDSDMPDSLDAVAAAAEARRAAAGPRISVGNQPTAYDTGKIPSPGSDSLTYEVRRHNDSAGSAGGLNDHDYFASGLRSDGPDYSSRGPGSRGSARRPQWNSDFSGGSGGAPPVEYPAGPRGGAVSEQHGYASAMRAELGKENYDAEAAAAYRFHSRMPAEEQPAYSDRSTSAAARSAAPAAVPRQGSARGGGRMFSPDEIRGGGGPIAATPPVPAPVHISDLQHEVAAPKLELLKARMKTMSRESSFRRGPSRAGGQYMENPEDNEAAAPPSIPARSQSQIAHRGAVAPAAPPAVSSRTASVNGYRGGYSNDEQYEDPAPPVRSIRPQQQAPASHQSQYQSRSNDYPNYETTSLGNGGGIVHSARGAPSAPAGRAPAPAPAPAAPARRAAPVAAPVSADQCTRQMGCTCSACNAANETLKKPAPRMAVPETAVEVELFECPDCGRKFSEEALEKHTAICAKVFQTKRKVFDSSAARAPEGIETVQKPKKSKAASAKAAGAGGGGAAGKWKAESEAFRAAMRAAREYSTAVAEGRDPPPPPVSSAPDPSLVPCPHCGRSFNEKAAERHIPRCQSIVAKPGRIVRGSGRTLGGAAVAVPTPAPAARKPAAAAAPAARPVPAAVSRAVSSSTATSAPVRRR